MSDAADGLTCSDAVSVVGVADCCLLYYTSFSHSSQQYFPNERSLCFPFGKAQASFTILFYRSYSFKELLLNNMNRLNITTFQNNSILNHTQDQSIIMYFLHLS